MKPKAVDFRIDKKALLMGRSDLEADSNVEPIVTIEDVMFCL
jgi:hypothetical protein